MGDPCAGAAPAFFATPEDFRAWLEEHAHVEQELIVGYYKVATGRASMTWSESVDEALCFGWIDSVRRRIDDESYQIRFSPRRPGPIWSAVNVTKVEQLTSEGRMRPAGLAAYEARRAERTAVYGYEGQEPSLTAEQERAFRARAEAWAFFEAQPPGYRRTIVGWVASAKRAETRERRLARLMRASEARERLIP
jgi:uncharacterized protein YdeI (YjbR/CyaY-like superfamily)